MDIHDIKYKKLFESKLQSGFGINNNDLSSFTLFQMSPFLCHFYTVHTVQIQYVCVHLCYYFAVTFVFTVMMMPTTLCCRDRPWEKYSEQPV